MRSKKEKSGKREFIVNVLGVPYKVHIGTVNDYPILKDNESSGLCDFSVKSIWAEDTQLDELEVGDMKNKKYLTNITLRHELMHAYFHESGLEDYAHNEKLVNFMAMSLEKIYAMCKDAGAVKSVQTMRKAA